MELIESPNRWSCLPASFAMAMGISFDSIIKAIGHDGSEIVFPDLPEPQRRRTFHIQECLAVSWRIGWSVMWHEFEPVLSPDGVRVIDCGSRYEGDISIIMRQASGVLMGRGRSTMHATAWCHETETILDPAGVAYRFYNQNAFVPKHFLSFSRISNQTG